MYLKEAHAILTEATKTRIAAIAELTGDPEAHWMDVLDQVAAVKANPEAAVAAISAALAETWGTQGEIYNMLAAAQLVNSRVRSWRLT